MNSNTQKALESLRHREINSSIAVAADLANDNPNSICRLALAWISDGNVHFRILAQAPRNYHETVVTRSHAGRQQAFRRRLG